MSVRWLPIDELLESGRSLRPPESRLQQRVAEIIATVHQRGDEALLAMATAFDGVDPDTFELAVTKEEWERGMEQVSEEWKEAMGKAQSHISRFHRHTLPQDARIPLKGGFMEQVWVPLSRVGLYVPGGRAPYPSSVLMTAVPARAAGVTDLTVCTPPRADGTVSPLVLCACRLAGVTRVFKAGGAGAIAAMAMGTETIGAVDKIAGPGNAYVNEAKRQLFGTVGIDCLAGPSELVVFADSSVDPTWVAADLRAQVEHGSGAWSLLVCRSKEAAEAIIDCLREGVNQEHHIDVTVAGDNDQAMALINELAPEHAHIMAEGEQQLARGIYNAGAVFIGRYSPVASGDYAAGPSHVLPTGGSSRFMSGLGVADFMKRVNRLQLGPDDLQDLAPTVETLAQAEGLCAHAASVRIRLETRKETGTT